MPEYTPGLDWRWPDQALANLKANVAEAQANAGPVISEELTCRSCGNRAAGISGEVRKSDIGGATPGCLSVTAKTRAGAGGQGVGASPPPPFGENHGSDSPDD